MKVLRGLFRQRVANASWAVVMAVRVVMVVQVAMVVQVVAMLPIIIHLKIR